MLNFIMYEEIHQLAGASVQCIGPFTKPVGNSHPLINLSALI